MDERVWGSAIVGCSQARVSDGFRARPLWDVLGLGFRRVWCSTVGARVSDGFQGFKEDWSNLGFGQRID